MKKCINCFQTKSLSEYYPKCDKYFQSWCKACAPEIQRSWRKRKFKKEFSNWVRGV